MSTIPIETLRTWITGLAPSEPLLPGDPRYVDLDAGPGARKGAGESCADELLRTILLGEARGATCQLLTGFPGSGKTTELHRLRQRLTEDAEATRVVWVNAEQFHDPFVPPTITDLLRILAWCLDTEAQWASGTNPEEAPGYLQRLRAWLQSDVQFTALNIEALGTGVMLEIKDNPDFRSRVEDQLARNFQAFATEAHRVIADAIDTIRDKAGVTRVVVIVDGLEKFQPLRPGDTERMEQAVEAVFLQHAAWLGLPCHVVYTFPYWLRWRTVGLGQAHDASPVVLPMVKVYEPGGEASPAGLALMERMVARRVDLDAVFGADREESLYPLLLASGGYPRDVIRLVRDTLRAARSFPAGREVVDKVIRRLAEEYELVALRSDPTVLRHVATRHTLPEGETGVRSAGRLIQLFLVLTYRNGRDWYDLHPLVAASPRVRDWLGEG